jgi:CBS domain-containing protein
MSLERFCRKPVITVPAKKTVHDAAALMRERHVGAVLVVDGDRPVGIVTDRDIVLRSVADGRDAKTTPVTEVMSSRLVVVRREDKLDDAVSAIRGAGVRRVPIVDAAGTAVGMVTLDDLVVLMAGELGAAAGAVRSNRGS